MNSAMVQKGPKVVYPGAGLWLPYPVGKDKAEAWSGFLVCLHTLYVGSKDKVCVP